MIPAFELKPGMALRLEGQIYKVVSADFKAGAGQLGGVVKTKLRNLSNGRFLEPHFRPDERLENLDLERRTLQFLFGDETILTFMNPDTYEQIEIPRSVAGSAGKFLVSEMTFPIEFFEDQAVNMIFPPVAEARVADTAPPVHAQHDSTWKQARLDNGAVIMVPLFIEKGETIHVDIASEQYLDRVRAVHKRGA